MIKTYKELIRLKTFEERFDYLRIGGVIGRETFGWHRYFNQRFYQSPEWKRFRRDMLIRDEGCDLAILDREIYSHATIHHINSVTIEDIEFGRDCVFDPDNVITTSADTHRAIHFGNDSLLRNLPKERKKGDMCPWLQQ